MAERVPRQPRTSDARSALGLAAAAGTALTAIGATVLYRRRKAQAGLAPDSEFTIGRGTPAGGVDTGSRRSGYEIEDTNVRLVAIVMAVSMALLVGGVAIVFQVYERFGENFQAQDDGLSRLQTRMIDPPLPHLQAHPYRDIHVVLMEQHQRLKTYGWDAPDHVGAHIPIAQAMARLLGKPLDAPAAAASGASAGGTVTIPTAPPRRKPAHDVQGEGNPESVAPSYDLDTSQGKP